MLKVAKSGALPRAAISTIGTDNPLAIALRSMILHTFFPKRMRMRWASTSRSSARSRMNLSETALRSTIPHAFFPKRMQWANASNSSARSPRELIGNRSPMQAIGSCRRSCESSQWLKKASCCGQFRRCGSHGAYLPPRHPASFWEYRQSRRATEVDSERPGRRQGRKQKGACAVLERIP